MSPTPTAFDFNAARSDGQLQPLSAWRGQVLLIVNTASQCGFTPQYQGLQTLWTRYQAQGLQVLGFPCNQFGGQEPGTDSDIAAFCELNFGVTFPLMAKIAVNGDDAHPLFRWLKHEKPGLLGTEGIKWNFTKFLVGRDGCVIQRYAPQDAPEKLTRDIEAALAEPAQPA
jgi:glutathione peroxidase